jgi:hypothetical protein
MVAPRRGGRHSLDVGSKKHAIFVRTVLLLWIGIFAPSLTSCVSQARLEQERLEREKQRKAESDRQSAEYQNSLQRIKDQYTPKDPTPQDLALAKERSLIYYRGLLKSIRELDDGISPADAIASAAVSENIDELKSWKRAQMAHLARPSDWTARQVEESINSLPSKGLVDEATSIVLRHRKGTL